MSQHPLTAPTLPRRVAPHRATPLRAGTVRGVVGGEETEARKGATKRKIEGE